MSEFKVIYEDLLTSAAGIDAALGVIGDIHTSSGSLQANGQEAGSASAVQAIAEFIAAWTYGLSYMEQDAHMISGLLRHAGQAYANVDEQIAKVETL